MTSDIPLTRELIKSEFQKVTKSVLSAKTRLRNAQANQQRINRVMDELGYTVSVDGEVLEK